jgi:CheY-like chemotaxis protein
MNGRELADEIRTREPDIKVLFTSGYTENAIVHHGRLDAGTRLLAKPYKRESLALRIRNTLDQ